MASLSTLHNLAATLWQSVQAWRRGEQRICPLNVRGRVYARKGDHPGGPMQVKATGTIAVSARIKRAGSEDWKNLGELK